MNTIQDFDYKGKKVLVRCDLNVPFDEQKNVLDDFRIQKLVPTIEYLISKNAKIILLSHLGAKKNILTGKAHVPSMEFVAPVLGKVLGRHITFVKDCAGREASSVVSHMRPGEIVLLENVRMWKEEMQNDEQFAKKIAKLADIYLNEAFSVCHRNHASVASVPKFLPSGSGIVLEKELRVLARSLQEPWRPFVVVIGGAKVESKAKLVQKFLSVADHVIVGGEIANAILAGKGMTLGKTILQDDLREDIEKIDITDKKLHLPVDGTVVLEKHLDEEYVRTGAIGSVRSEEKIFDIGPETMQMFSRILEEAKLILWSGPVGFFEHKRFERGTKELALQIVKNHSAFKIAGGGDTIAAIRSLGLQDQFDHISVGGGAMLAYLAREELPGLTALEKNK